jgi:hypothetical protein
MPVWYYFSRPTHMTFHDLTSTIAPPRNLRSLLGLGLKFIPTPSHTNQWSKMHNNSYKRFERDLRLRAFFAGSAAKDDDTPEYNPRMYVASSWTPPDKTFPPELPSRLDRFNAALSPLFKKKKARPNLLPHQRRALLSLQNNDDLLIVQCDKNLGPAVIEKTAYIEMAFRDHLSDGNTYMQLAHVDIIQEERRLRYLLGAWLKKHHACLSKSERKFLKHHIQCCTEPFPTFYLTMKVHKKPLKSRPIVSCSGSLLEGLGIWVDSQLQIVAKLQRSYFKSSFDLVPELRALTLPPSARLFTADAVSMYTNIPTSRALNYIGKYLTDHCHRFPQVPIRALMEGLSLVMKNNIFSFGDTRWKQTSGTAMGTPPAPPFATLYYAILEDSIIDDYSSNLLFYRRFIDDVIGIWDTHDQDTHPDTWPRFIASMNDDAYSLEWEVSELTTKVDFMDLTLSISDNGTIFTTLYQKPSNFHLYIPPHSAHPPGLLSGMIYGTVHRIHTLCSSQADRQQRLREYISHLQARGYKRVNILPIFQKALTHVATIRPAHQTPEFDRSTIFFHLQYHPDDPPSGAIQRAWHTCILAPAHSKPLECLVNHTRSKMTPARMIVAYSRPFNLGNLLSYRKLRINTGPPVSSYGITD